MSRTEGSFDFGFDLDDVLFPCAVPLIEELKKAEWISQDFTIDHMTSPVLYEQFGWGDYKELELLDDAFFARQKPFPDVLASINLWKEMGARVCFITARRESVHKTTEEVMLKLGFDAGSIFYKPTSQKHLTAQELGLLLFVDDRPECSLKMVEVIPYSFNIPYRFNEYVKHEIEAKKISNLYREKWAVTADLITSKGFYHSTFAK